MKALILNSGLGSRMGAITDKKPKCMLQITEEDTILSKQLKILVKAGIENAVITTGPYKDLLERYCMSLNLPLEFIFVHNPLYDKTNYIYSIYLAKKYLDDNIIMIHGDLVFHADILLGMLKPPYSTMATNKGLPLPSKDFKATIKEGTIKKIGIDFFDNAVAAQPLYKLNQQDWSKWLNKIITFCEQGQVNCYAENAFNEISNECTIFPFDYSDHLCMEIDTLEDLKIAKEQLR